MKRGQWDIEAAFVVAGTIFAMVFAVYLAALVM